MLLLTKDVYYGALIMLNLLILHKLISGTFKERRLWICFYMTLLLISLIRNDGIFVCLALLAALFIGYRQYYKRWLFGAALIIGISLIISQIICPILKISAGSKREMLSIPFQQTARYVHELGMSELTPEENEVLSKIFTVNNIGDYYVTFTSDQVKENYNENATSADLRNYFKVWFQMFLKHPKIYFEATIDNVYGYFYQGKEYVEYIDYDNSAGYMKSTSEALSEKGISFNYPEGLWTMRRYYEKIRETLFKIPPLSIFLSVPFYVWLMISWLFYSTAKKNKLAIIISVPFMMMLLICLAGPRNGWYFRYLYPYALCAPAVILSNPRFIQRK